MDEYSLALHVENRILLIRGYRVMLDTDLAEVYGTTTKRLNEQVKRNHKRFPLRYMFQLTPHEKSEVVANCDHLAKLRFSPVHPFAFTEHGAIMLASVLNSDMAIKASLGVVDAFVRLRELLSTHKDLARQLKELEKKYDAQFRIVFDAIRNLMKKPRAIPLRIKGFSQE
jgi:hypothetical protein